MQKAIEAGAEFIPATVFPEVTGRDAAWAQQYFDFGGNFSILVSKETLQKATSNELKSKEKIKLCTLPRVLSGLGEHAPGIYTRAETIYKLAHKHHLSNNEIEDIIKSLDDPLLVIKESSTSFIFYLPVKAKNKAGNIAPVMAALRMQRDEASGHYLMSAYPLDSTQKIEERIRRGDTVYSKYNKAALSNSNAPSPFKPDLVRLLVNRGFTDSVLTEEDIVNYNFALLGISESFTAEEANFSIQAAALPDRFACPIKIDNQIAFALLTLKRTDGNKLYSIELEEINQLGGTLDRLKHLLKEEPSTIPLRANVVIVAELFAKVKEYFGENAYRSIFANTADANFSIAALAPGGRFQSNPLAECMSNFMRTEARRYERTLSKQTPGDAAANALFATQSIIHAVDKYVQNGTFKLPRESMVRLKHARALIDKYAQMMKSGKVRSFNMIDKAERAEQAILSAIEKAYSRPPCHCRYSQVERALRICGVYVFCP